MQTAAPTRLDSNYLGEAEGGAGLTTHHLTEPGLALDDAVGHAHLTAEGRQEQHDLQRVDVVGDHHQLSLLLLNLKPISHRVITLGITGRHAEGTVRLDQC